MDLYSYIEQRKSSRKYTDEKLPQQTLGSIDKAIKAFNPLYENVPLNYRFANETKGLFRIEAPYHMVICGNGAKGEKEQAGFIYEQLVLWLHANEIGSVWLGATKDTDKSISGNDILILAFGKTTEPLNRAKKDFIRKPINEITNAPEDICIQAVHLAPSGMNTQPWYFEKTADNILVYQKKLKAPISMLYKFSDVDMGIALCHYCLACEKIGKAFKFVKTGDMPPKTGYLPFGIIT